MKLKDLVLGFSLAFFLLLPTGCKTCGTGAGNPLLCSSSEAQPIQDDPKDDRPLNVSESLVFGICNIIVGCETQLTSTQCTGELFNGNWLNEFYQLEYASFSETRRAEADGLVAGNEEYLKSCLEALSERSCSDALVAGAYPFETGLLDLLETEQEKCGDVLK